MSANNADEAPSDDSIPKSAEAESPDDGEGGEEEAPDWLLDNIAELSQNARSIYLIYLGFLAYCTVTIVGTTDRQILLDESVRLPLVGVDVSFTGFFLIAPLVAIGTFVYLQLYLQRLKRLKDTLRAEYESVETGRLYPWMLNIVDNPNQGLVGWLQRAAVKMVLWWLLPAVLFLFSIRYLKAQDPVWGFVVVLVMPTVGSTAVLYFWHKYEVDTDTLLENVQNDWAKWSLGASWAVLQMAVFYLFISTSLIGEAPPLTEQVTTVDVSYQSLITEQEHSQYWVDLSGKRMHGANLTASTLTNADLRNAHLERADLRNARLDSADLREAYLGGANLVGIRLVNADLVNADLNGANLHEACLNNANLVGAQFGKTDLSNAHLNGADLEGAQLDSINLVEAHLNGANLDSVRLNGATLADARLDSADLSGAELDGANLRDSRLNRADLSDAQLGNANLQDAELIRANLHNGILSDANLIEAKLTGATLSYAQLSDAEIRKAKLDSADLKAARLESAILGDARLVGANLFDAQLDSASLVDARLTGANLFKAKFSGADLRGAWLTGADLSNAELSDANLSGAKFDSANLKSADLDGASLSSSPFWSDSTFVSNFQEARLSESTLRNLRCSLKKGGQVRCAQYPETISEVVNALCEARSLEGVALDSLIHDGVEQQCPFLLEETAP